MTALPTFVARTLDDLGQGHLAGDLTEELRAGRSSAWIWWQVTAAIVTGVIAFARREPFLVFRAVAVGWIALQIVNGQLPFSPHLELKSWVAQSWWSGGIIAAQYAVTGWVVALFHRRYRAGAVIVAAVFLTFTNAIVVALPLVVWPQRDGLSTLVVTVSLLLPLLTVIGGLWVPGISRQPKRTAPTR